MEEIVSLTDKLLTSPEVQRTLSRFDFVDEVLEPLEEGMPAERYLTDRAGGIQVEVRPNGRIGTVFLYAFGKDGFGQFPLPLPNGLTFLSTQAEVEDCLGQPSACAKLDPPSFGVVSWVKYVSPSHSIHFSFTGDGISLVTIMPPDWQPGS